MKVLISSHASLFPPEHGGAKSIRHMAELLAAAGAQCLVLVRLHPPAPERMRFAGQHADGLAEARPDFDSWDPSGPDWTFRNVRYQGVAGESADLASATAKAVEAFSPDAVILCDDSLDEGRELYEAGAASGKLVFFAQTIHSLPFGAYAMKPSRAVTAAIGKARRIIAPSNAVKAYIEKHLGRTASVWYPDTFGRPPFPRLGNIENPFITMINPCPWKGSSIFIELARLRPDLQFAVVPTWGAIPPVIEALKALPNVTFLPESPRIDDIFARTRILLAPSICQEAFGLVSPEAMLRGIPVVASNIAGLKESTLGAAHLIPVEPLPFDGIKEGTDISKFQWAEPHNPAEPWSAAIDAILESSAAYQERSERGRARAEEFVRGLAERDVMALFQ